MTETIGDSSLAIEVKSLVKRFKDVTAVAGLDLAVRRGECFGLLGPNGSGKTTTVEILAGLQQQDEGAVHVLGREWRRDGEGIRARIGIQLQETFFYEKLTVAETVRLFRSFYPRGLSVEEAIGLVSLEEKRNGRVGKLSGGQKQRLALAVALAADPELLFMDEPTTGLDPQSRHSLWDVIESLKKKGRTVLLTTHYMDEAEKLCDRVAIVDHGKLVALGSPHELITSLAGEQVIEFAAEPKIDGERLRSVPGLVDLNERNGATRLAVHHLHEALPALMNIAQTQGCKLVELATRRGTLDDVFLAHTGRSLREEGEA